MNQRGDPTGVDTESRTTVVVGLERSEPRADGSGCLAQIFGAGLGQRFDVVAGEMRVGRDGENEAVLARR